MTGIGNYHNFSVIFPRRTCNFSSITCLRSFRLSENQTSLFSYRDSLETWNFPCCRCTKQASEYESHMQQNQEGFSVIYCGFESSKTPIKILRMHMLIRTFVARRCGNYKFHKQIVLYGKLCDIMCFNHLIYTQNVWRSSKESSVFFFFFWINYGYSLESPRNICSNGEIKLYFRFDTSYLILYAPVNNFSVTGRIFLCKNSS